MAECLKKIFHMRQGDGKTIVGNRLRQEKYSREHEENMLSREIQKTLERREQLMVRRLKEYRFLEMMAML